MSEISFSLDWNEKNFLKGAKLAYDFTMKHSFRRFIGWFFIAMLQFGVVGAVKYQKYAMFLLFSVLTLYWYFFRWPVRKFFLKKAFKRSPLCCKKLQIKVDDEGFYINSELLKWENFKKAISSKEGYLLDFKGAFLFIPKNSIENKEAFFNLLKNKIKNFQKVDF